MPRAESRPGRSSTKRNKVNAAPLRPNKRRRVTQSSKKSEREVFPLLELPPEVLDIVLSYVIEVPWNPSSATFRDEALRLLFPATVLQTNRFLRGRCLDLITQKCLWVRIDFLSKDIWESFDNILELKVPHLPLVYRKLLPPDPPGVKFVLGDPETYVRQTRKFNTETMSMIFPFNYQSYAAFYGAMISMHQQLHFVRVELSTLPAHMRRIVNVQILSTIQLLRAFAKVSVVEPTGKVTCSGMDTSLTLNFAGRIDLLMSMVLALDAEKRVLEGSILCMYVGHIFCWLAIRYGTINYPSEWKRNGGDLAASDWLQNPNNLERMRLVRTLFYVELRAFQAYVDGMHEHGTTFVLFHYKDVTVFWNGLLPKFRWVDLPVNFWFGLPDHEVAAMFHVRAFMMAHNNDFIGFLSEYAPTSPMIRDLLSESRSGAFEAVCYALRAWNMDMKNLHYASTLNNFLISNRHVLRKIRGHIADGDHFICDDLSRDTQQRVTGDDPNLLSRAKQLAWSVNVAYDQRREIDMPVREVGDEDLTMVKRLLGIAVPGDTDERFRHLVPGPNWNLVGLAGSEFFEPDASRGYDVAPWSCWTPM